MRWTGMGREGLHSAQQQNCWTWNHVDCNVVSRSGVHQVLHHQNEAPKNCKWIESPQTLPTKLLSITTALQIVRLDDFMEWNNCQQNGQNWNVNGGLSLHCPTSHQRLHSIYSEINVVKIITCMWPGGSLDFGFKSPIELFDSLNISLF